MPRTGTIALLRVLYMYLIPLRFSSCVWIRLIMPEIIVDQGYHSAEIMFYPNGERALWTRGLHGYRWKGTTSTDTWCSWGNVGVGCMGWDAGEENSYGPAFSGWCRKTYCSLRDTG